MNLQQRTAAGRLIKDIADYKEATSDTPVKILLKPEIHSQLKASWSLDKQGRFKGIKLKKTEHINKDWILV